MINYIIPLLQSFMPMWEYVLVLIFALTFLVTVPNIIREFVRFR